MCPGWLPKGAWSSILTGWLIGCQVLEVAALDDLH